MATLRQQLFDTGLFKDGERDLSIEVKDECHPEEDGVRTIRVVLRIGPAGELLDVEAMVVDTAMRCIVAQNRRALGLPPQEM